MKMNPLLALPKPLPRRLGWRRVTAGLALALSALAWPAQASSSSLVIAEAYGGGGNSGSVYKNDFIVVFNRGTTSVDVNGWSVQYASTSGSSWTVTPLAASSLIIPPGGYFLVQEAAGSGGTTSLPTPDASGNIAMSGSGFKVALCNTTTALSGANPVGLASVIDFVGCGSANAYEGTGPAPAPSNSTSVQRNNGGCTDNDQNATDFTAAAANPRNSATPLNVCPVVQTPPTIITAPNSQSVWITTNVSFTVAAAGDPVLSFAWSVNKGSGFTPLTDSAHVAGSTTATLWLTNVSTADAGTYRVTVHSSTTPPDATADAVLTVSYPSPTIVYQPQSQTELRHSTAALTVAAQGVPSFNTNYTYTYQWQKNVGGSWTPLSDGSQISGSTSKVLTISNFDDPNTGDYRVIVTSTGAAGSLSATSDPATLSVADSGTLVSWNFNNPDLNPSSPAPSQGEATATATTVGSANGFLNAGGDATDTGVPNNYWGSSSYPNQYVLNKSSGVQFRVSTVGFKNVVVSFSDKASATASLYTRFQYTTNGSTFIDFPTCFTNYTYFNPQTFDLTGFPNVRNNPNFGFRLVSEFESTAIGSASAVYDAVGSTSTYGTGGTLNYDLVKVTVVPTTANTPPTIAGLANVVVKDTSPTATLNFTVTPAPGATITSVSATSLNPGVASDPIVNGSFTSMSLSGYAGLDGQAPILVTATDSNGEKTTAWFTFTVNPLNVPPTITGLPFLTNTLVNAALTVPITVTDDNTAAASLVVSAVAANATVASASVSADLGGGQRKVTVTPAAGAAGVVPVSVIATDGGALSATNSFVVIVCPSTAVVMNDFFDYAPGAIVSNSFGLWLYHSGTYGQMDVVNGNNLYVYSGDSEDVHVPLLGAPYLHTDESVTLYSSFIVSFNTAPAAGGSYFAHFRDENSGAMTGFSARLWASTDNAATGKFRLGIGNGSGATADNIVQFPMDLAVNTPYLVVTRYVPSTGLSTLWVNPSSETSPSVTATDAAAPGSAPNQIDVTSYGFRQANSGEGNKHVDSLRVGTSFAAVMPNAAHIDSLAGTTLSYSAGLGARVVLQTNVAGLLAPVWGRAATNATSPGSFTVPAVGSSAAPVFYRIQSE